MDILEEYAARHPQFRICRNAVRKGINGNFFSAMRKARGEYIAVCDQDDLWAHDKMEKQMEAIGNHLFCTCRSKPFSSDGTPVAFDPRTPNYHLIRLLYCSIPGHSMLFHRRLLELLPDTTQDYHTYYDVYLSLTAASNDRAVLVDEWLVSQRRHEGAHTYTKPDNRRTPSAGNALFILKWSLRNFHRVQPYMYEYFQRRLRLMQGIKADSPPVRGSPEHRPLGGEERLVEPAPSLPPARQAPPPSVLHRRPRLTQFRPGRPLLHHAGI